MTTNRTCTRPVVLERGAEQQKVVSLRTVAELPWENAIFYFPSRTHDKVQLSMERKHGGSLARVAILSDNIVFLDNVSDFLVAPIVTFSIT